MKKLITISLIFISGLSFGQNLWKPTSGSLVSNVKFSEGIQVTDTTLLKGITIMTDTVKFTKGITVGYIPYIVDTSGKLGYQHAQSISPWTGNGTNVYLRDSTDNVIIGRTTPLGDGDSDFETYGKVTFFNSLYPERGLLEMDGRRITIGDIASLRGGTNIDINDETKVITIGSDSDSSEVDITAIRLSTSASIVNFSLLPSDSSGLAVGDLWFDINGFIRRKF